MIQDLVWINFPVSDKILKYMEKIKGKKIIPPRTFIGEIIKSKK